MTVIGSVGVRVAPTFTGLNTTVSRAFGSLGRDAGRAMSRPVQTSLREAVRVSITSASTDAYKRVETATLGVTSAEEGLRKAKRDTARAAADVQVAEEKLTRLRDSGKATAGELAQAEARLNDAKDRADGSTRTLTSAEARLQDVKAEAATASKTYEEALQRESTALYKVEQALPVVGQRFKDIGANVSDFGRTVSGIGGDLTRKVTVPALGAATAVGGVVAALGFKRLVGIDTAQAKLRGLGYDAAEVETITGQVTSAIEGTMVTMAEGVNIAAGALAAGVDEGEDLERYIRLVGDAAAASGRPIDEMAMIFNRVQGTGKLMTQELNMLEQSVPGVSQALADSYGVSYDAFREMVTNGEVDAKHFREVMDEFMGGMGEEYSKSFEGMAKNVVAYIGILGENLLGGAFPQMKESLAEFVDFLASDEVAEWAQGVGESIGQAFGTAVEWVKTAIDWWMNLDDGTRKLILTFAGIAVVLGPVLLIVGKLITFIGGVISAVGSVIGVLGFLLNPITWVVAAIAGLVAGLVWFFTQTEIGQKIVETAWSWIQRAIAAVVDWATGTAWPALKNFWDSLVESAGNIWQALKAAWSGIQDAIDAVVGWVTGTAMPALSSAWESTKTAADNFWDAVTSGAKWLWSILEPIFIMIAAIFLWVGTMIYEAVVNTVKPTLEMFATVGKWLWNSILKPTFNAIVAAFQALGRFFVAVWTNVLKPMIDGFASGMSWLWTNALKPVIDFAVAAWHNLGQRYRNAWTNVVKPMIDAFVAAMLTFWSSYLKPTIDRAVSAWQTLSRRFREAWTNVIRPMIKAFGDFFTAMYRNFIRPGIDNILSKWRSLRDTLSSIWSNRIKPVFQALGDFVKDTVPDLIDKGVKKIKNVWDKVSGFFRTPINWVINTVWNDGLRSAYNKVADLINAKKLDRVSSLKAPPAFRKGGYHKGGWAMVGEEGPELAYFGQDARILTNRQTQEVAKDATSEELDVLSGKTAPTDSPIGGLGGLIGRGASWVAEKTGISSLIDLVRGALASGFRTIMKPVTALADGIAKDHGGMGDLASGFLKWGVDKVADLIDTKDQEQFSGGEYMGKFVENPGGFNRPSQGRITSWAGPRNLKGAYSNYHHGVDLSAGHGAPVRAAWSGVVKRAGSGFGTFGNYIVLNHGGFDTAYAHLSRLGVSPGQDVKGGQVIGSEGNTGGSMGAHLHFERHVPNFYNPSEVNSLFRDMGGLIYPGLNMVRNETGGTEYVSNQRQFDNTTAMAERLAKETSKPSRLYLDDGTFLGLVRRESRAEMGKVAKSAGQSARGKRL